MLEMVGQAVGRLTTKSEVKLTDHTFIVVSIIESLTSTLELLEFHDDRMTTQSQCEFYAIKYQ